MVRSHVQLPPWSSRNTSGCIYTDNVGGQPVLRDYDGNQLIRVPKVSVRVVPGFNLFGQRLRLQASWEWEGARYVDTANSVVLPKYDVLNASGRLRSPNISSCMDTLTT